MSKIKLLNNQGDEVTIEHSDTASAQGNSVVNIKDVTKQVDTITDLKALDGTHKLVYVTGYHTKGDGAFGSHFFEWDATSIEADNGGTIIKLNSVATGRYKLKYDGAVNVKWFGAVGDGITDDITPIQNAIDAHQAVYLPYGNYKITQAIVLSKSYSAILGDMNMPQITIASNAGAAINVTAVGSSLNEFSRVENVKLYCDGIPSYVPDPSASDCGFAIDGSTASVAAAVQRFQAHNIRLLGFGCGIYSASNVNTKLERIVIENHDDLSSTSGYTSSNKYVGMYFDATPFTAGGISPQASIIIKNCIVNGNGAPANVTSICYFVNGQDPRDIFFKSCETAGGNYGFFLTTTDDNYNIDVHINKPIIDAVKDVGIYIENFNKSAVSVYGGYIVKSVNNSGAGIWIAHSTGVTVTGGTQILGVANDGTQDEGIRLQNSNHCAVNSVHVMNCRYGISLQSSEFNSVVGNIIDANILNFESNPTLSEALRIFSISSYNAIIGNTISGASSSYPYDKGINLASDSPSNSIIGNVVEENTVTTEYVLGAQTTTFLRDLSSTTQLSGNSLQLVSYGASMSYRGNDSNYPHQFYDGGGNAIAGIDNSGSLVANSDRRLKTDIKDLPYGLSEILALNPKMYKFKNELVLSDDAPDRLGLISQDVQSIIPEVVQKNGDYLRLNYIELIPILVNAVKELAKKIQ